MLTQNVNMGTLFLAKCAKTARGVLQDEPLGTLQRIFQKRIQLCRTSVEIVMVIVMVIVIVIVSVIVSVSVILSASRIPPGRLRIF